MEQMCGVDGGQAGRLLFGEKDPGLDFTRAEGTAFDLSVV
jgi:hypothetical protein